MKELLKNHPKLHWTADPNDVNTHKHTNTHININTHTHSACTLSHGHKHTHTHTHSHSLSTKDPNDINTHTHNTHTHIHIRMCCLLSTHWASSPPYITFTCKTNGSGPHFPRIFLAFSSHFPRIFLAFHSCKTNGSGSHFHIVFTIFLTFSSHARQAYSSLHHFFPPPATFANTPSTTFQPSTSHYIFIFILILNCYVYFI